jgi:N-acylneuraminate cytidylyltransferase
MINRKTILAIIPARGGSKGIPGKNIKQLVDKPLIAWTIEEAKKSKYIDRLILSSEDEEIISVAKEWGCEVPFVRPKELALDETPGIEPVIHAINTLAEKYDYVCLLQPTSPLRKVEDIDGCVEKCVKNNADSCVSVTEVSKHPFWMYEINNEGILKPLFRDKNVTRRQDLPKAYSLNGAVYFSKSKYVIENSTFIKSDTMAFCMDSTSSIDIDNEYDMKLAEYMLLNNNKI